MKPIGAILTILVLSAAWPCFAGYDTMKEELAAYRPEHSAAIRPLPDTGEQAAVSAGTGLTEDRAFIQALAQAHEEKNHDLSRLAVAMGVDETVLAQVSPNAGDPAAMAALVRQPVHLEAIKAIAVLRNPDIQAARKKVLAEILSFEQVTHLEDTLRQYAAFTAALDNRAGPIKSPGAVRSVHPFPGLTALKGRVVLSRVNQLEQEMGIVIRQTLQAVETTGRDLIFTTRSIRIIQETTAAFERLLDVAASLYRSGKTSYQDVIKVTIKIETLKQDRVSLENEAAVIQARLAELMNLPAETRIGPVMPGPLPQTIPGPKTLAALARENRQELAALRFQIRRVQSMLEMSESMTEARFTTGLSYWDADHVNSAGTGALQPAFAEKTMASMKNNRPQTPWYGVDGPWVQQTRQTLAGLTHTLTARENATDRMVADAWADIDKLRRELALYQDRILPLTESALEVSTREYEAGAIAFSQAIGSYTDWLSVKLTIARKTRDLGIALAVLESIVGNPL
jgi:hypothetical protein